MMKIVFCFWLLSIASLVAAEATMEQKVCSGSSATSDGSTADVGGLNCAGTIENGKTNQQDGDICFYLAPNGDGLVEGIKACAKEFKDVDDLLSKYCWEISQKIGPLVRKEQCDVGQGARLVTHTGVRVLDFNKDILQGERVYVVPQGLHFLWPLGNVGDIIIPRNVESPIPERQIRLIQLSQKPRVFQVENFIPDEEVAELIEKNEKKLTPSEVGFAGWVDKEGTRTSYTSWDTQTKASKLIRQRTFSTLAMGYDDQLADALQVLRYEPGQWYKPHTDYFDEDSYDGNDPSVNNGTNRFATMFLYLSTVEEGGHTVFPLSTTHKGYNGEKLVADGTIDIPGSISNEDAKYSCNITSTALRSPSIKGNAVLFYSQLPDGTLDPYSLHGGCPPIKGTKWSGNVWIWNRPSADKSKAKDKAPDDKSEEASADSFAVRFVNEMTVPIDLFWDPNFGEDPADGSNAKDHFVEQGTIKPGKSKMINTYDGHTFHALVAGEKKYTYFAAKDKEFENAENGIKVSIKW